ncbi:MAG: AAA family ATPase [Sulfurovum sp.]|nr:AAA family ATPase [Sulfurovum sp.]
MKLKKLPIGIQTFSKIRNDDYIYIDKTKEALELIENYTYTFFISSTTIWKVSVFGYAS